MPGFVVYNNSCASFLIGEGFELIQVRPDNKYKNRRVYIFKKSDELEKAIMRFRKVFVRFDNEQKPNGC